MRRFIFLLLLWAVSCKNYTSKKNSSPAKSLIDKRSTNIATSDTYREIYYNTAKSSKNIDEYIKIILKSEAYVDTIIVDNRSGTMRYVVLEDTSNATRDFYVLAKTIEFDWTYYLYNDLYKASFHFPEINSVSLYDKTNRRNITYLPAKSDMLYSFENNVFPRRLYVADLNYNTLQLDCAPNEKDGCVVIQDSIFNQLKKAKHIK